MFRTAFARAVLLAPPALAGDTPEVTTDHFWVRDAEGCGGAFNLAETMGATTTYRLQKAADPACLGG